MTPELLALVRKVEGLSLKPYVCPAGFWTIGYGHLCRADSLPISIDQAEALLQYDIFSAEIDTRRLCPRLTGTRLAAITDFTFNLGAGRLRSSTLLRRIRDGAYDAVPTELAKWTHGGGRILPGLVARRAIETSWWRINGA